MVKNRLKEIRMKEFMMEQKEFAAFLGEKQSTYSQWEAGVNLPTMKKAFAIAKKLNKSLLYIWYEEED